MKTRLFLTAMLVALTCSCFAQQNTTWGQFTWLLGEWKGEGSGQPGQGGGIFSFGYDLDQKVIIRKSHSEYTATSNKPEVIHNDLMVIYLDNKQVPAKAIYFDNEGHVINYSVSFTNGSIIFTSNKEENTPVFRLTYTQHGNDLVNTKFEFSQDGIKFTTHLEGESRKTLPGQNNNWH